MHHLGVAYAFIGFKPWLHPKRYNMFFDELKMVAFCSEHP